MTAEQSSRAWPRKIDLSAKPSVSRGAIQRNNTYVHRIQKEPGERTWKHSSQTQTAKIKLDITVGQGGHKSDLRERTWGGGGIRENFYTASPTKAGCATLGVEKTNILVPKSASRVKPAEKAVNPSAPPSVLQTFIPRPVLPLFEFYAKGSRCYQWVSQLNVMHTFQDQRWSRERAKCE